MSPTAVSEITLPVNNPVAKSKGDQQQQEQKPHVYGGEGLTALQALSHGGIAIPGIPSFTSQELKRHWQLEHMAGAFRIWARHGYTEGMSGHISVRDPEHTNAFWTNPLAVHFGMLKASDMILVDLSGNVIGGNRSRPANAAGFLIHAAVHKAREDVNAVCHAHTIYGKAWSSFARPLEMLNQDACKFFRAHSVYESYGGVVLAAEEGDLIAKALGNSKGCILMNHGLLTVGGTVDEAAYLFGLMERSCQIQLLAESASANGCKKILISDEEAAYNFKMESDPESLYCEFQPDYEYEDMLCSGAFKN
ncbi:aldolase [Histoplasma capsulatum G186AR]|uniref:Aldolase n=2 Tax=Ajellomyces capsulatus TaxID=5037 RepID=C0NUU3_AJECG|nr:aldolase [Histoplasma capsulatum G186AR]EEH04756.1 aldolase [Histoplasma capsulatum G186AR]KAG5287411.1 aldolase [Histoplasma capsulatum]QSS70777.1 aldolase [Histoplasma capsulatum G186AR]